MDWWVQFILLHAGLEAEAEAEAELFPHMVLLSAHGTNCFSARG
jgi:hypothetical protein